LRESAPEDVRDTPSGGDRRSVRQLPVGAWDASRGGPVARQSPIEYPPPRLADGLLRLAIEHLSVAYDDAIEVPGE
jgi:hypothetical protein